MFVSSLAVQKRARICLIIESLFKIYLVYGQPMLPDLCRSNYCLITTDRYEVRYIITSLLLSIILIKNKCQNHSFEEKKTLTNICIA